MIVLDDLVIGAEYDRPTLAAMWEYAGWQAIARGVITPRDQSLIVLFVTQKKQESLTQYDDRLEAGTLFWEGEEKHGSDARISNAEQSGETIVLFYRTSHHQPFVYHGPIQLTSFAPKSESPSCFEFRVASPRRKQNPTWTEPELVIALDTVLAILDRGEQLSAENPRILNASRILIGLPIHPDDSRAAKFRDPDEVRRRCDYFKKLHSGQNIDGRRLYREVWEKYSQDRDGLRRAALAVADGALQVSVQESQERTAAEVQAIQASDAPETEKETLIKARRGQGKFRLGLIEMWGGCAVTKCSFLPMLRASHIKPWRICSNAERLDPFNGLLLTANLDALFDKGCVTFCPTDGKLIMAPDCPFTAEELGLRADMQIAVRDQHRPYLRHHAQSIADRNAMAEGR